MKHDDAGQTFPMVPVGDSADSRLFIELSSYGSDLAEARHALDLATQGFEEGSPLAGASHHLVGIAVVTYCRTILPSNVRGRLTDHIDVPDEMRDIHYRVKAYRNATIAHSQSELAVTYAVGVLDSKTLDVRDVMGPTIVIHLPQSIVREFRALIDVLECRLDRVIEPVRARLKRILTEIDEASLKTAWKPEIREKWAHEFDPKTKRSAYPTGHSVYWDTAPDGDATQP